MTRAAVPKIEDLPPFPEERDVALLILGPDRAKHWPAIKRALEKRGFPRINPVMGGRKLVDVLRFFDDPRVRRGPYPYELHGTQRNFVYAPYAADAPEIPPLGKKRTTKSE